MARSSVRPVRLACAHLLRVGAGLLCLLGAFTADAIITLPASTDLWHQTSGRERCATIGDWYTSDTSGSCSSNPTGNPLQHELVINVPQASIDAGGGSALIRVVDAESFENSGDIDEVNGSNDPVRFWLEDENGASLGDVTISNPTSGDQNLDFVVTSAGDYTLRTQVGAFPISGISTTDLNNDDNSWKVELPDFSRVIFFETTLQHSDGGGLDVDLYFTVGPGVTGLQLRNFDVDGGFGSITYRRPSGAGVAGTESGNGTWNNGGNTDTGADIINGLDTGAGGSDIGVWTIEVRNWNANNQAIFEVLDQNGDPLPVADDDDNDGVTNSGTWTMAADTTLNTLTNVAVDHPFTVTNSFTTDDVVNFDLTSTLAGVAVELRVDGGAALTDTDSDGRVDTGTLARDASVDLVLRVSSATAGTDVTTITGESTLAGGLGTTPVTIAIDKTTTIDQALTVTKSVVDLNGGEADEDDVLEYTIVLTNNTASALTGLTLTDTVSPLLGSIVLDPLQDAPPANDISDLPNNLIEVETITVAAGGTWTLVFEAAIEGAAPGDTIDNSVTVTDGAAINESADAATVTVSPTLVPNEGTKQLYLFVPNAGDEDGEKTGLTISRAVPSITDPSADRVRLAEATGSETWVLSPELTADLTFRVDTSSIVLFLSRTGGNNTRVVEAQLFCGASLLLSQTVTIPTLTNSTTNPADINFTSLSPSGGSVTCAEGNEFSLTVNNLSSGNTNRRVRVYAEREDTSGTFTALQRRSRLVLDATTIIEIDEVEGYTDTVTATGGSAGGVFTPGDSVFVRAVVSDPFGFEDITSASLVLTDANGSPVATGAFTSVANTDGTRTFEVEVPLVSGAATGNWTMTVTAVEGVNGEENTDVGIGTFEVGLPDFLIMKSSPRVYTDPVNGGSNPKRIPGAVIAYEIQVSNQGRGRADDGSVVITDNLASTLRLGVATSGNLSDAIGFDDDTGSPSGLTLDFPDDVTFLVTDGMPPADADSDGCYDNVEGFVVTPTGRMNGQAPPAPNFTLSYRACVQ